MTKNFSSIRKLLLSSGGASLHRHVFILAGEEAWQKNALQEILLDFEASSLWVGEQPSGQFPSVPVEKATTWLGNEKQVVIFDANKRFDPDSFAAITGIVIGGGIFFLLLPEKDKWNMVYPTSFGQRLLKSIDDSTELKVINQSESILDFSPTKKEIISREDSLNPFVTIDQKKSVEAIEEQALNNTNTPVVLISDRGRGKSAALGIAAARLMLAGVNNIAITAPRLRATDVIFKHIAELLPDAEVARGKIKYKTKQVNFYSPDQLMENKIEADLLLIDEAAAIPVPLLSLLLNQYKQCVFATTVHGYEGTGRGFALRFFKELDLANPDWIKLQMQTPIRWALNDPLEMWMFDLLCLDAELVNDDLISDIKLSKIEYCFVNKTELAKKPALLKEVFSLLVLAHYRTRPKDLKNLLDDENISLYVAFYNKHAIAVSLVIQEGSFSESLSTEVYRGHRRPQGHLLAQALTYHCGIEQAAMLDYSRVMRIAVHPNLQQKGIGTKLLKFIITNEKEMGRDAIGTSFGMNAPLLSFWEKLDFNIVRIGFTREQTSGEHAAVMLLALSDEGKIISKEAIQQFKEKLAYWLNDVLKDLSPEIKSYINIDYIQSSELTELDKKDLHSFIEYSRNYELCIAAVNKFALKKAGDIANLNFPENFSQVINKKILENKDWKSIGKEMNLSGKNEARSLFHQAIVNLTIK